MGLEGLHHLLVLAEDMDETRDFYRDVLGFVEGDRPPLGFPGYWLYSGGVAVIHIAQRDSYAVHAEKLGLTVSPEHDGAGPVDHVAFRATGYDELLARFEAHGLSVVRQAIPSQNVRQLYVHDPNGVQIEVNVLSE